MISKLPFWVVVVFGAFLMMGCATETGSDPLKPPSVYRDAKVYVTRAPTEEAATALPEATPSATALAVVAQPQVAPLMDDEEFLLIQIDYLFDKIERKLNSTDVNP